MDIAQALALSARGMDVQTARLRTIAENLANQDTTGSQPGAQPYRRKLITFENRMDSALGTEAVRVRSIKPDQGELPKRYDPSHPAADSAGYVLTPNVNSFVEIMDMREAQRAYTANLNVMEATRSMLTRTIELLK
ncbi:MAG: flagellar basal body rod protein FlgC [Janthinobacterium lividum]